MIKSYSIKLNMLVIKCPLESCTYEIPAIDSFAAASCLILHKNAHINARFSKPKPPNMNRHISVKVDSV